MSTVSEIFPDLTIAKYSVGVRGRKRLT